MINVLSIYFLLTTATGSYQGATHVFRSEPLIRNPSDEEISFLTKPLLVLHEDKTYSGMTYYYTTPENEIEISGDTIRLNGDVIVVDKRLAEMLKLPFKHNSNERE